MRPLLITLFASLLSIGVQAQESEIINNKDWFGQESAEVCTAWTMAGKLLREDVSESIELKITTPKALKKMPAITLTISEAALPVELVEDLFTASPKISRDKRWYFNKITTVTSPEGLKLRALEYSTNPENIRRVSRDLIGLSKLPFELRTETNRYRFSVSLRGSTKTVRAMVKDCAERRFRSNNPLTADNKTLVEKIISDHSESSDGWKGWTVSPAEKITEIDATIEKGGLLNDELNTLTSDSEYVNLKNDLDRTTQLHINLVDTISRDQSLLKNYEDEKVTKTRLLPSLISEETDLNNKLPGLESEYRRTKSVYNAGEAELVPFTERRNRAQNTVNGLESDLNTFESRKRSKERELSQTESNLNSKRNELSEKNTELDRLTNRKNRRSNEIENLRNSENRIRRNIENRFGHRFNSIDGEISEKNQEINKVERRKERIRRLGNLANRAQQNIQRLNRVQKQIDNLAGSVQRNQQLIKQKRQEFKRLKAEFDAKDCQRLGKPNPEFKRCVNRRDQLKSLFDSKNCRALGAPNDALKQCRAKRLRLQKKFDNLKCNGLGIFINAANAARSNGRQNENNQVGNVGGRSNSQKPKQNPRSQANEAVKKCKQQKKRVKTALDALNCKALDDSAGKVKQCRAEAQDIKSQIQSLRCERLNDSARKVKQCRNEKQQIKRKMDNLKAEIARLQSQGEDQLKKLRQQKRKLKGDLADIQQRVSGVNGFERFNEKANFTACQANKNNKFCRAQVRSFKQAVSNRANRISNRVNEIKREQQNLRNIKSQMNAQFQRDYTEAINEGERTVRRLRNRISSLNDELIDLRSVIRSLDSDKSDLEDQIVRLRRKISDTDSELGSAKSELDSAQSARTRKKIELDLDSKLSAYRTSRRVYRNSKSRVDALPGLIVKTRSRLASLENLISDKTRVITENQAIEIELDQKISTLKVEISPLEAVISSKQSEIRLNTANLDKLIAEWVGFNRTL